MTEIRKRKRDLIQGRAALIVVDIQCSTFAAIPDEKRSIAHMPDYAERMARTKGVSTRLAKWASR